MSMRIHFDKPATTETDFSEPVPQALHGLVEQAVKESATDVHIDAWQNEATIRFRVDGTVYEKELLTYEQSRKLINQIKVAAGLELPTTCHPLEGHFRWFTDHTHRDIRVTTISTAPRHEAAHLRLLTPPDQWQDIHNLGFSDHDFKIIDRTLQTSQGLVLVSGPTGAGKTTTLYSLTGLTDIRKKIAVSIEDPTECDLPYVRQLEVKEKQGFTMEEGLQTVLRLDPDIILVGEIRDAASAKIATRAALAGRLVLATVHAQDAAIAIEAMHYMSVPYYVLGGALRLVIAQDLIRKLCPECKQERPIKPCERTLFEKAKLTPPETLFDPVGCSKCFDYGYQGRIGIFQVVTITHDMANWLTEGPYQRNEIREKIEARKSCTLHADAMRKAADGITSMKEAARFF